MTNVRLAICAALGSGGAGLAFDLETLIEIGADRLHQRLDLAVEEMVGAGNDLLLDHNALLRLELVDKTGDILRRNDDVLLAMHDQPGRRAGREEREIVKIGRRRNRNEA